MTIDPLFSIVIPTYNRASLIQKTLASVLAQKERDFEVLVVDDGSTDSTGDVVNSVGDKRIRYFRKENGERGAARNFGVEQARGKYIVFLDSDDIVYANHLSVARHIIEGNPGIKVFHLGYELTTVSGEVIKKVQPAQINHAILHGNMLSCNGVVTERTVMLANKFNEDRELASLEDWELWIRMCARLEFPGFKEITSAVIQHPGRSVYSDNTRQIARKVDVFCSYVREDEINQRIYGNKLRRAIGSAETYAALHIAMAGKDRHMALDYLWKGITHSPREMFKRRFVSIVLLLIGLKRIR